MLCRVLLRPKCDTAQGARNVILVLVHRLDTAFDVEGVAALRASILYVRCERIFVQWKSFPVKVAIMVSPLVGHRWKGMDILVQ